MQRLFGVSLVLGAERRLTQAERRRAAEEIQAAVADLRSALARPVRGSVQRHRRDAARGARAAGRATTSPSSWRSWEDGIEVPAELEALAQSVLAEALRNAHKHARPEHDRA